MAWREALFLTNDDGIDAPGLHYLISQLHALGHPLAVLAPASQQSASGMRLTLHSELKFENRSDLIEKLELDPDGAPVRIYSLDGTPCDCVVIAMDGGFEKWAPEIRPRMCISGINRGPNVSVDIMHSGTVSAAREAALYGMPSMALSLATYLHEDYTVGFQSGLKMIRSCLNHMSQEPPNKNRPRGSQHMPWISESLSMPEKVKEAFLCGDLFLNVNFPHEWTGKIETVGLGARWYLGAATATNKDDGSIEFEVGAASIQDEEIPDTDCLSIMVGSVAITPLATWPQTHPLNVPNQILRTALQTNDEGYPAWLD